MPVLILYFFVFFSSRWLEETRLCFTALRIGELFVTSESIALMDDFESLSELILEQLSYDCLFDFIIDAVALVQQVIDSP